MTNALIITLAISSLMGLDTSHTGSTIGQKDILSLLGIPATHAASLFNPSRADAGKIIIKDAWIQEGPPSQKITAAFMVIENHNSEEISLLSASTDVARVVELHTMEFEDGIMRMRQVASINIPAEGSVELKPGGYHLMVIDVNKELKEGADVKVTLRFSNDVQKTVIVPVKKRSSMAEEGDTK
ncbi:MAG: copper chaperone PCu(A)C [Acidobacteria bacterium]|nr:copper chaperone PCu(A)C [Acidobacteriota bacterium]